MINNPQELNNYNTKSKVHLWNQKCILILPESEAKWTLLREGSNLERENTDKEGTGKNRIWLPQGQIEEGIN